jgi:hypothetical protein
MKTAAEIANHPRAVLVRRIVNILRATGGIGGAEQSWLRLSHQRLWETLGFYGLTTGESQNA